MRRDPLTMSVWFLMFAVLLIVGCNGYSDNKAGGGNPHVAEAISHGQEAVEHGGMGHPEEIVKHAGVALQHAEAAKKEMSNPHLDAGISELKEAVNHGNQGHADVATKHAKSAVSHLKEI